MNRSMQLAQRRAMLIAQCTLQRNTLQAQARVLSSSTGWMKTGEGMLERLKNIPGWAGILLAAAVIFIPGRAARLARSGLMLWQFWRNLKSAAEPKSTD